MTRTQLWNKFWKDKHGKIVIWQTPNIPLWTWFLCTLTSYILPSGQFKSLVGVIAFGAIFTWAYLEISSGVNYFRRALGLVVIVVSVISRIQ